MKGRSRRSTLLRYVRLRECTAPAGSCLVGFCFYYVADTRVVALGLQPRRVASTGPDDQGSQADHQSRQHYHARRRRQLNGQPRPRRRHAARARGKDDAQDRRELPGERLRCVPLHAPQPATLVCESTRSDSHTSTQMSSTSYPRARSSHRCASPHPSLRRRPTSSHPRKKTRTPWSSWRATRAG